MKAQTYHVISIEETEAPAGMDEGVWHRYTIGQGTSKIEGMRSGSLKAVTQHAESFAKELNDRAINGGSTYAPRKKA